MESSLIGGGGAKKDVLRELQVLRVLRVNLAH